MFNHRGGKAAHQVTGHGKTRENTRSFTWFSHLVTSVGGNGGGHAHLLRSISDRDISKTKQIKGRMGKTKELGKNCPSTYYMERGLTSRVSLWLPDLQNSVNFISFSEG